MEPVWENESFDLIFGDSGSTPTLDIECYDMDIGGPADFLGMISIYGKDLLNPPHDRDLVNGQGKPGKNVQKLDLGGRVYELQKKPGKKPKFNRMVQGSIMVLFDHSDAELRKKVKHDAVKVARFAEAQKEARGSALKHSYRMAKKHMKKFYEEMMQDPHGRNNAVAWVTYRAHRKEYERAKQNLHDHQFTTAADFHCEKAVDPEEIARIEKEFSVKRAKERLRDGGGKRKKDLTLSEQLAHAAASSGMTSGPGGAVHHHKRKKKGHVVEEIDYEATLLIQAQWNLERENKEQEEMSSEDPLCHSWRPAEAEERRLMEEEGVNEHNLRKDAPEWEDPEPEDFDPPVIPEWNNDWKVGQENLPMLPVARKTLFVRLIDCRGLEKKGYVYIRVWWCGKEVGRTDSNLLYEHAQATGKGEAFLTDPVFQYEQPFLLPMPDKKEDAHLSVEVWGGPICRGQVTIEGSDLLKQAFSKADERDKMKVPFQLFPLRRTLFQKTEDSVRHFFGKARLAQGKVGMMITMMERGEVFPPKWPSKKARNKENEGTPEWMLRFPTVYQGVPSQRMLDMAAAARQMREESLTAPANDDEASAEEILARRNSILATKSVPESKGSAVLAGAKGSDVIEELFDDKEGGEEKKEEKKNQEDATEEEKEEAEKGRKRAERMTRKTMKKEAKEAAEKLAEAEKTKSEKLAEEKKRQEEEDAAALSADPESLNRGNLYTREDVDWEKLAGIKYPDYVFKFQILSARDLAKADFMVRRREIEIRRGGAEACIALPY